MTALTIATGPRDPRIHDVDDDFRRALVDLSGLMLASAWRESRFFHETSVSARGILSVADSLSLPEHSFFRPGRKFRVIARYSNSQGTDDVSPTVRGLTLRLSDTANSPLLDLTFNTGTCFFAATAEQFRRAFAGPEERAEVLAQVPAMRSTIWSNIRLATSYPAYDFHSQVPQGFVAEDGRQWLIRYRIRPDGEPERRGDFDHGEARWPPDAPSEIGRPADDERPPTVLRDELRARIAGGGVASLLQAQLHPVIGSPHDERAMDASRSWPEDRFPWTDLAELHLTDLVTDDEVSRIAFDPALAPPELGIVLTRSPHSTGSLNHLRALLYRMAALGRSGRPLPAELAELLRPIRRSAVAARPRPAERPRTVCVLGAGATGLTVARELERAGHRAIVVEAATEVGGKCESVQLDGRSYDLGGHICTSRYHRMAALAEELGVPTEPTTPYRVLDTRGRTCLPDTTFFHGGGLGRYQRLRAGSFPRIAEPGLAHSARALADPVRHWLAEHDLESMADTFGAGYTAAGFGYLDDGIPALYFVKYAEMTGLLSTDAPLPGHIGAFTVSGGFATVWQRVAEELRDVRRGMRVLGIERDSTGVRVRTDSASIAADDLVVTVPPDQILSTMDPSVAERELAAMVRYHDYRTTLVTAEGLPRSAFHILEAYTGDPAARGHCVALHHRYADRDVHTCYSYGDPDSTDRLTADLTALDGPPRQVHLRRRWPFMPHIDSERLRAGALDRLEGMQGERHTYYTGSLVAFELVECVVAHAQELVRRHFPARSPVPARDAPSTRLTVREHTVTEVRQWLIRAFAEELQVDEVEIDSSAPLERHPLNSVRLASMQAALSDHFDLRVPQTLFLQAPTIDAAALLLTTGSAPGNPEPGPARGRRRVTNGAPHLLPLVPVRPFFCAAGVGGSAAYLRPLADALGGDQPFFGMRLPDFDDGGEPLDTVEDIAEALLAEIREVQPAGPYRLGGHSLGGLVAYELGCRLRAAGQAVDPVVVLDSHLAVAGQPAIADDEERAVGELLALRHLLCPAGGCRCKVDRTRPIGDQQDAVFRTFGVTGPVELVPVVASYQAGLRAVAAYDPPSSDLAVHLLVTAAGFAPLRDEDHRVRMHLEAPALGWEFVRLRSLTVSQVGGGHFSLFQPPHLHDVIAAVRSGLGYASPASPT